MAFEFKTGELYHKILFTAWPTTGLQVPSRVTGGGVLPGSFKGKVNFVISPEELSTREALI